MRRVARSLAATGALIGVGVAVSLFAGLARAQAPTLARDNKALVEELLEKTGWKYRHERGDIFRVPMQDGPDVWVHTSGDNVSIRAIVGDLPAQEELTLKPLLDLLRANFSFQRGKFGLDEDRTVWFEINTPIRLIDAKEVDRNVLYVARQARKHRLTPEKKEP